MTSSTINENGISNYFEYSLFEDDIEDIELSASASLRDEIRDSVVFTLDWSVGSLINQLERGSIDLQPQFQRRDAWQVERKSRLIESLILGLPVPQIVLAEQAGNQGSFLVLDGKQRLTALIQFVGGMPSSPHNGFRLTGLRILNELNGLDFPALQNNLNYINAFTNQPVRTVILRGWKSEDLLHLVFHRLNSNVVPLSPQELRQALIRGPFLPFLNNYAADSKQLQLVMKLNGPDFRMRDTELLLRLLALSMFSDEYRGDLRVFLDSASKKINQSWESQEQYVKNELRRIELSIDLWADALGGHNFVGRRFHRNINEPRLNRAVLDAQIAACKNENVLYKLKSMPEKVATTFKEMFDNNQSFVKAIEATTKSIEAVSYRSRALTDALLALE